MKAIQHTPGPWQSDEPADADHMARCVLAGAGTDNQWIAIESEDDGHVAYCHPTNAALIAAGPELLAAISTLVGIAETDCMDDKSNVWRSAMIAADAAIAKAEGRA
jgi:hypothetical protein